MYNIIEHKDEFLFLVQNRRKEMIIRLGYFSQDVLQGRNGQVRKPVLELCNKSSEPENRRLSGKLGQSGNINGARLRELRRQSKDSLQTRMHHIDDLRPAVSNKPTNRRVNLCFEVPIEQT